MKSGVIVSGFFVLIILVMTVWVTPALATSSGQASHTTAQASFPIYRLKPPTVTTQELTRLAGMFGMKGQPIELDDRLVLQVGSQTIEIYKASGAVWYADESQLFNPSINPTLPTENAAKTVADQFLTVNGLIPPEATFDTFTGTITKTMDATTLQESTRRLDIQVLYGFSLNGLPIGCGGGKLKVTIGDQGEIINFFRVWREIDSQVGVFQVLDQSTADQAFRDSLHGFQTQSFSSTLAYCSAPAPEAQNFLAPAYLYNWDFQLDGETFPGRSLTMPATGFAPLARITSPESGTTLPTTHLLATSSVSGGTPPYTFRWESSIDGLLGTEKDLSAYLSSGWRDNEPLSHAITLTVTDSNGLTATDAIEVGVGAAVAVGGTLEQGSFGSGSLVGTMSTALGFVALVALSIGLLMWRRKRLAVAVMFIALSFFLAAGVPSKANAQFQLYYAGTEWIGPSMGLPRSPANAAGFFEGMTWLGWERATVNNRPLNYGDRNAKEWHFRSSTMFVENANFIFYSGHANMNGFPLWPPYDSWLGYWEAQWGRWRLKWLIVAACGPMEDDALNPGGGAGSLFRWTVVFHGLHQLLGYGAVTYDNDLEGRTFTHSYVPRYSYRVAWFRTAIDIQPSRNGKVPPNGPLVWVVAMWATTPTADPVNDHECGYPEAPGPVCRSDDPYPPSGWVAVATVT